MCRLSPYRRTFPLLPALLFSLAGCVTGCVAGARPNVPNTAEPPAASTQAKITGIYSSMRYHEESGDILGHEFFIIYAKDGYYLLYQESEGWPAVPLLLPVEVNGNTIRFAVPSHEPRGAQFEGTITPAGLTGSFQHTNNTITLPRKASYWQ